MHQNQYNLKHLSHLLSLSLTYSRLPSRTSLQYLLCSMTSKLTDAPTFGIIIERIDFSRHGVYEIHGVICRIPGHAVGDGQLIHPLFYNSVTGKRIQRAGHKFLLCSSCFIAHSACIEKHTL